MKKTLTGLCVAAAAAFGLAGCSPYTLIDSETYNNADLASYRTFRIVTPEEGRLPPGMQEVTYYNIAAAIREQMVERGFVEDPSSPLLINIGITIQREIATEPAVPPGGFPYMGPPYYNGVAPWFMYPRGYYWNNYINNYYSNAQIITGIYKEGVLTMDLVNVPEKLPLFSASVATVVTGQGYPQFRNLEGIAEAVNTLFSRFPVKVLPQYKK